MPGSEYDVFMIGGMTILVIGVLTLAWAAWRRHELSVDGVKQTIDGVSHEVCTNVQRAIGELGQLARGEPGKASMLMPAKYPMIDLLNAHPFDIDRKATHQLSHCITLLEAARLDLRTALARGGDSAAALEEAMEAGLQAIIGLYLWEMHKGVGPAEAASTRSRAVREWMKARAFDAEVYPDQNLRDEVIRRLRAAGMTLTPKPLSLTASEYWSRRYDRKADPRGPFGRRPFPKQAPSDPDTASGEAEFDPSWTAEGQPASA